jgi:uncharacterized protein (TIGR02231 family)
MKTSITSRLLRPAFISLQLSAFSLAAAAAAATPVESQITAATVYTDRAVVTRTATLENLAVGEHELALENLPGALMDDSLQVYPAGSAQVTILDVNARNTFVEATTDPKVKELEDRLKDFARERRGYDDRTTIIGQQRDYLLRIQTASTTPVGGTNAVPVTRPGVEDWTKLMDFTAKNLTALDEEAEKLDQEREDLQARQTAAEEQLNQLRNGGPAVPNGGAIRPNRNRNVKTVTVRVAVATAGTLQLALAYGVRGASWSPSYDARLRTGADRPAVELAYFGNIRQNTGEDWKNVALTLSTARPSLGGGAPELHAWVLDEMPQLRGSFDLSGAGANGNVQGAVIAGIPTGAGANTMMLNSAVQAPVMAPPPPPMLKEASYATAAVESGVTSASYKIPGTNTVLSDNAPQKVNITTARLTALLQYQAAPRTIEAAFLNAYVTNTSDFPLLAGPMNTFLNDTFIAASALKTVMPNEKFNLALGADEAIAVKRRLVNRLTEQTGFTGGGVRVTYEFLITVTNNKKTPERFVFKEVLPVSRNDKIVVKLLVPTELLTPAQAATNTDYPMVGVTKEEDGRLVWREDLKPGEKREFPFKFSVEYPADFPIMGLE